MSAPYNLNPTFRLLPSSLRGHPFSFDMQDHGLQDLFIFSPSPLSPPVLVSRKSVFVLRVASSSPSLALPSPFPSFLSPLPFSRDLDHATTLTTPRNYRMGDQILLLAEAGCVVMRNPPAQ